MKRTCLLAIVAILPVASLEARADVVSDRVLLTTGPATCGTGALGFHRTRQMPDGSQTVESAEFQVPSGSYLEVVDVEYITPYWTAWAKDYQQWIDVSIRQRTGTASTVVLAASYQNRATYGDNGNGSYVETGEVLGTGGQTHAVAFAAGPLMSSDARLCAVPNTNNFWIYGGRVTVRGRLIPTGDAINALTTTTNSP